MFARLFVVATIISLCFGSASSSGIAAAAVLRLLAYLSAVPSELVKLSGAPRCLSATRSVKPKVMSETGRGVELQWSITTVLASGADWSFTQVTFNFRLLGILFILKSIFLYSLLTI